jgi:hypothetical protein
LGVREAIALGIVKADQPATGRIITKAADERRANNPRSMLEGIPRAKTYFNWPGAGALGLMLIDGDEIDEVFEILVRCGHHRGRRAGTAIGMARSRTPAREAAQKGGTYSCYDDPSRTWPAPHAILRLSWCIARRALVRIVDDGKSLPYGLATSRLIG